MSKGSEVTASASQSDATTLSKNSESKQDNHMKNRTLNTRKRSPEDDWKIESSSLEVVSVVEPENMTFSVGGKGEIFSSKFDN